MTPILYRNSCAPKALSILFKDTYDRVVRQFQALGADYTKPSVDAFERVLEARAGIKRRLYYPARQPRFTVWRRMARRGRWATIVTAHRWNLPRSGHCVVLRDGEGFDNNWIRWNTGALQSLRVHCAYELQT